MKVSPDALEAKRVEKLVRHLRRQASATCEDETRLSEWKKELQNRDIFRRKSAVAEYLTKPVENTERRNSSKPNTTRENLMEPLRQHWVGVHARETPVDYTGTHVVADDPLRLVVECAHVVHCLGHLHVGSTVVQGSNVNVRQLPYGLHSSTGLCTPPRV